MSSHASRVTGRGALRGSESGEEELDRDEPDNGQAHPTRSSEEVAGFIRATFRSVWALELLMLLRTRRVSLGHDEMVRGLRASDLVVTQSVESLAVAGLVLREAGGSARYGTVSAELDAMVADAEALYLRSPDAVRRLIVTGANPAISAFADAFKLWKD